MRDILFFFFEKLRSYEVFQDNYMLNRYARDINLICLSMFLGKSNKSTVTLKRANYLKSM